MSGSEEKKPISDLSDFQLRMVEKVVEEIKLCRYRARPIGPSYYMGARTARSLYLPLVVRAAAETLPVAQPVSQATTAVIGSKEDLSLVPGDEDVLADDDLREIEGVVGEFLQAAGESAKRIHADLREIIDSWPPAPERLAHGQ